MELLLDSLVFLWWDEDDPALGPTARARIADPDNVIAVSVASVWELAIKRAAGKLLAPFDLVATIAGHGFATLPIEASHAVHGAELPMHHRDPFDRLLVAQAMVENLTLVTSDPQIAKYDVELLDASA